jgi:hypothetical protein
MLAEDLERVSADFPVTEIVGWPNPGHLGSISLVISGLQLGSLKRSANL